MAAASIIFSVEPLSDVCSETTSDCRRTSSSGSNSTSTSRAAAGVTNGSYAITFISRPRARRATSVPTRPSPTRPRVFPRISVPENADFSQRPGLNRSVRLRHRARQSQHQRDRVLRHADGVSARRIHHQHAALRGRFHVHVVHAHARAADHAQLRRFFQQRGGRLRRAANHQCVGVRELARQQPRPPARLLPIPFHEEARFRAR